MYTLRVVKSEEGFAAYERKIDLAEGKYEERLIAKGEEAKKIADAISGSIILFSLLAGLGLFALGLGLGMFFASRARSRSESY